MVSVVTASGRTAPGAASGRTAGRAVSATGSAAGSRVGATAAAAGSAGIVVPGAASACRAASGSVGTPAAPGISRSMNETAAASPGVPPAADTGDAGIAIAPGAVVSKRLAIVVKAYPVAAG